MAEKKLYSRKWLNKKEGLAAVELSFTEQSGDISIRDCSRVVTLEFYYTKLNKPVTPSEDHTWGLDASAARDGIRKIQTLQNSLEDAKQYLSELIRKEQMNSE